MEYWITNTISKVTLNVLGNWKLHRRQSSDMFTDNITRRIIILNFTEASDMRPEKIGF